MNNVTEILIYLMSGGGAGALASFIGERIPAFQNLTPGEKKTFMILASIFVAICSWGVLRFVPSEVIGKLNEPVMIIFGVVTAFLGNQAFHKVDPARKKQV